MKIYKVIICIVLVATPITGCTVHDVKKYTIAEYVPWEEEVFPSKTLNYRFAARSEEAWKASVHVFAHNNIEIQNIDKDSGFIKGTVMLDSESIIEGTEDKIFESGEILVRQIEIDKTITPSGFVGSGNPSFVKMTGNVKDTKETEISRETIDAKYMVETTINFLVEGAGEFSEIMVNIKFQPTPINESPGFGLPKETIYRGDAVKFPKSTGAIEDAITSILEKRLGPQQKM